MSTDYYGLNASEISSGDGELTEVEKQIVDCLVDLMEAEDRRENEETYMDGLHFTLNQPELARNHELSQTLTELIEKRDLARSIIPSGLKSGGVEVIIGKENDSRAVQEYSVVISQYGLPDEAAGTISVMGPTRMPYARTIATVGYLSMVLSGLVSRLYGRELSAGSDDSKAD
jgi:heat-inducible transcriptional repressor